MCVCVCVCVRSINMWQQHLCVICTDILCHPLSTLGKDSDKMKSFEFQVLSLALECSKIFPAVLCSRVAFKSWEGGWSYSWVSLSPSKNTLECMRNRLHTTCSGCHGAEEQWQKHELKRRILSSEVNPHVCGQLIFDEGAKNTQWGKDRLQQMVLGILDKHMQKDEIGLPSSATHRN